MTKEILQLLQDASEQDPSSDSYEQRIIRDNDFEKVAAAMEQYAQQEVSAARILAQGEIDELVNALKEADEYLSQPQQDRADTIYPNYIGSFSKLHTKFRSLIKKHNP